MKWSEVDDFSPCGLGSEEKTKEFYHTLKPLFLHFYA
jgi:hypothetical protein